MLLHIVERLEGFLGKLPATIQKPILSELTPLKQLFLQQRSPHFLLVGSSKLPLQEFLPALSPAGTDQYREILLEVFRWQDLNLGKNGIATILDARGADDDDMKKVTEELKHRSADFFLYLEDADSAKPARKREVENLATLLASNGAAKGALVGVVLHRDTAHGTNGRKPRTDLAAHNEKLHAALIAKSSIADHLISVTDVILPTATASAGDREALRAFTTLLTDNLPNEARVEMIRVSDDREAQARIAQTLVKSTSAICTAIGAQPIPLADLPILTTLQLVMVSGIMQLSGRERSLRAATEFIAALGVNVGAGMLLREGARAALKFFPGWGNVVCGMVAGAGTYALGRAAMVYFLEGQSLKDARRIYLSSKKKAPRHSLPSPAKKAPERSG